MDNFIVYGLFDPRNGQLRYVGKSCSGLKRAKSHCYPSSLRNMRSHCNNWLKSLVNIGMRPEIEVLEIASNLYEVADFEVFWIGYAKMIGCNLTNMQRGGELGRSGLLHSKETKVKMAMIRGYTLEDYKTMEDMYVSGKNLRWIAKIYETSSSTIYGRLKKNGVKFRDRLATVDATQKLKRSHILNKPIIDNNDVIYKNAYEAATRLNLDVRDISYVLRGKHKKHRGMTFKLVEG